jgi:tripartite ATP-independent transporter DctM subunit
MFAAISGSSLATAATIGTVAIPALQSRAYNERLSLGSIAAGSTLGILIPPSIGMIIYGAITNTSIGHLFIAGILPGILLAVLFSLVIAIACLVRPRWAGTKGPHSSRAERLKRLRGLVAPMAIIALIVGAIYLGWATPTESAGVGVVAALLFAGATGNLSFEMLHDAFRSTVALTGMILLLIVAAFFLNFVISLLGVPQAITEFVVGLGTTPTQTLLVLVLFYLVLGCFLETMSMMIATVPIVVPVVVTLGFDPVWFGVVLVVLMEMALITPPIGLNLYIVQGVRGRGSINDTIVGTLPFLIVMLVTILLLIRFPGIALWLPGTMGN